MKTILQFLIILLLGFSQAQAQSSICCPKFTISAGFEPCDAKQECRDTTQPHNGGGTDFPPTTAGGTTTAAKIIACKLQSATYTAYPNLPGYTYNWTVLGGTPVNPNVNPVVINWSNTTSAFIQVIVTSPDGKCKDTVRRKVCLLDGPTALFTHTNPTCVNSNICFNSSGSVGGNTFYWDFGDGQSSTLPNPCHVYTTAGTYNVILTLSNSANGKPGCGCIDTFMMKIIVNPKPGIDIHADNCKKMLCFGDTVKYCTSTTGCSGLTWSVVGGTIISGQGTTCATIVWNVPVTTTLPSVTLNATCASACSNTATLEVPVLYPNLPIQGNTSVCINANATYSLPAMPGTFYHWTLSGGGTITTADSNHNVINVAWSNVVGGPYTLTCNYNNPITGCSGVGTTQVYIKPPFTLTGASPVCTTTSNFYTANGAVNTWIFNPSIGFANTPVGATQQNVTWTVPGPYSITATTLSTAFCTSSATVNVVVNPKPVLNPIVGPTIVCKNTLYNYTASSNVPGGNYTWLISPPAGTSVNAYGANNASASLSFGGTGNSWVVTVGQNVNGCLGTTNLMVNEVAPPPAITLSAATICSGGTVTATVTGAVPPGGYNWSATPGAVYVSGQGTTTATFVINSNATITISNCAGSSSASVTVNPANVSISQTPSPCGVTLTATAGAATYQWFLNGVAVIGAGNVYNATLNGTYLVVATFPSGCKANSTIVVTGITPVIAYASGTGGICNGGSATLVASNSANCVGATYLWSNGATGSTISVTVAGTYTCNVTCSNGCTYTTNPVIVPSCGSGSGNCINDVTISPSNCNNPVNLTATWPAGCSPTGIVWNFNDGSPLSSTGIHTYVGVGTYQVYVSGTCADGSAHCGTQNITVPMVDSFTVVTSCNTPSGWIAQLQDASLYLPSYAGYSILWSTTCGTLSSTTSANPTLTIPFGCNPTVTLTISKNGCTLTKSFTFGLPTTAFTINGPTTVCINQTYLYSSSYTTGIIAYNWNFGDATSGVTNPISHTYDGLTPSPTITLQITDQFGCTFTTTKPITLTSAPKLTISPSPVIKLCPDCASPVTLTTSPAVGFGSYQWYHDGIAIPGANSATYQLCTPGGPNNAAGNYWVTAISNGNNCNQISDTVYVVYLPKPIAKIVGNAVQCGGTTAPYNVSLSTAYNANYSYNWTASGPGLVTFNPNNTSSNINATVPVQGLYQFIVTVTDNITGCVAKDTLCVYIYQNPTLSVTAPSNMCAGTMYTMTATASPTGPSYIYNWSNGISAPSITTSQPGSYNVTAIDPVSGCTAYQFVGTINTTPYVALFPIGCDTICDTSTRVIIPPLPLMPGGTYGTTYIIKWYLDGNYHSTAPSFSLAGLSLGNHTINIVVEDLVNQCTSTSGMYNVYVKSCKGCNCKESKFTSVELHYPNIKETKKLECGGSYELVCKQSVFVTGTFNCVDTTCPPKVTYSLQPPAGAAINSNTPITITPTISGLYTLTMYGWCGDKICDSCKVFFKANCDSTTDCCKGSFWSVNPFYYFEQGGKPAPTKIDCGTETVIYITGDLCNKPLVIGGTIQCPTNCIGKTEVVLYDQNGNVISTNPAPYSITGLANGVYYATINGYCGGALCLSCKVVIKVDCKEKPCDCKGSKWGDNTITINGNTKSFKCPNPTESYAVKCNQPITINASYLCADATCTGVVTYSLQTPTGNTTGSMPLTFTPTVSGLYTVTMYGSCGGRICDSCVIRFKVNCPPSECCPKEIVVTPKDPSYTTLANATLVTNNFIINGVSSVTLTEVRANVVSYQLSDNFNKECLRCVNLPYSWASIHKATPLLSIPANITMFGGTSTPLFSGTGTQAYQNPREVIWNNGTNFTLPANTSVGMSFLLPLPSAISCCEIKGKICIKFTFRDKDCKECEVISCFDFVLPKSIAK